MEDREEWSRALAVACEAAKVAGGILQDWRKRFSVSEKSRFNLVTEADFAAEEAISKILQWEFPEHAYLGEEGLNRSGKESAYRWIIDPLDGTGNYVHGFPYYCVSIGLEQDGQLVLGVIYDPNRDELFHAVRGRGAFLNGETIRVSHADSLSQAMCVASLPVNSDPKHPAVARFLAVLPEAQSVQRLGSAAMNLAYLACGRLEAFWSTTLKSWDMAAGALIVTEAGGQTTRLNGEDLDVHRLEILATCTPEIHSALVALLNRI